MKVYQLKKDIIKLALALCLSLFVTVVWAQDSTANVNIKITKESTTWYAQPWVWILGGAVFLLLLVALLRGSGNRD